MIISNTRSDYIILTNNIIDSSNINIGTNLHIKTKIIDSSGSSSYDISWKNSLSTLTNNNYKNRIILSGKIITPSTSTSCCLITKNNIKNNMKYIIDISNSSSGKILFVKNLDISDNSFNYLFNDLSNVYFENNASKYLKNTLSTIDNSYNRYIYNLNYYFSNSDLYKINIRDYLYKYARTISNNNLLINTGHARGDLSYNAINYTIKTIKNDFSFINVTIDSSSSINFKASDFSRVLIDNSNNNNFTNSADTSLNLLNLNQYYSIYRNIWSYNILTLDFKHVNSFDFSLNKPFNSDVSNINTTIKTFLIKTNNFKIIQNIKKNSKIIFGLGNIYLNNIDVLDITSTSYVNKLTIGNSVKSFKDASNIIFLRLGKRFTGLTQRDIYNHVRFYTSNDDTFYKIKFKKNINTNNINTNSNFAIIRPNLSKCYLLDISLNYNNNNTNNISNSHNINNTINFNNILFNNVETHLSKVMNLDFNSYFDASSNNYLKNSFNTLARLNTTDANFNLQTLAKTAEVNSATYIEFKDISYSANAKILNLPFLETILIPLNSDNGYDFRYNYGITFYVTNKLNILVNLNSLRLTNTNLLVYKYYENSSYSVANFYTLQIDNLVTTTGASDFTNVDCIYIYHDPINDPDPKYRYPNNNIEIKYDNAIDTLSKAIEQYRGTGARSSTTNAAFIPSQNGSNLSRKMIQGIIGLNNIPKLLSIVPYDPASINGRGFINQYQITDTCIEGSCYKIAVKQNAIKHESVKNNSLYASNSLKKQNFANAVRSSARNKLSQECIKSASTTNNITTINGSNTLSCTEIIQQKPLSKITPFVMFRKGKYL